MGKYIYSHSLKQGTFCVYPTRPDFPFNEVKQVHGINCSYPSKEIVEADALIQNVHLNEPMLIKTADCLPIVFEGEEEVVFLHAGWRGLALGILDIEEIKKIKPLSCFIGPAIGPCCFEVGDDFNKVFSDVTLTKRDDKYFVDLIDYSFKKIKDNFPDIEISHSGICTMCNELFHSYRRNKTIHRNFNVYFSKDCK